jgi:phosphate transport system substrate-binding protein
MKSTYTIALAIVVLVIIIGSVVAYTQLGQPAASPSSSPTATLTSSPTASPSSPAATPGAASLTGAGATFPQPFLNSTIVNWQNIRTNVQISYTGGGSGAGISALTAKTVDFACSDAALSASQREAAPSVLHIPETIGAITLAYNIPGISTGLKLTGPIIADIFLGSITNWNNATIQNINPDITLPDHSITVVHRSDSSGTSNWFTKYLSSVNPTWNTTVGSGSLVEWPIGIGQSGNSAVASTVVQTEYSIGYVELAYALQNNINTAAVQNPAGNYIMPSLASSTAAAESLPTSGLPTGADSWSSVNILNAPGSQAYPVVVPTYMLVYKELNVIPGMTLDKATQLVQYIWYVVHDGQALAEPLEYAAIPANLVQINEVSLNSITFNGQPVPPQ